MPGRKPVDYRYDMIPVEAIYEEAKVWAHGFLKYPGVPWREYGLEGNESPINHAIAHLYMAIREVELKDTEEAIEHLAKARCNIAMAIVLLRRPEPEGDAPVEFENPGPTENPAENITQKPTFKDAFKKYIE